MSVKSRKRINPYNQFVGCWIPLWLLERPEISPGAKLIYATLARHAGPKGDCFPGQNTLAQEIGLLGKHADRSIRNYIKELVDHLLVEKEQWGLNKTNRYYFLEHPWMDHFFRSGPEDFSVQDRTHHSGQNRKEVSGIKNKEVKESGERKQTQEIDHGPSFRKIHEPESPGFEKFWEEYPRKAGKMAAYKAWLKTRPCIVECLSALSWQKKSEEWKREDGRFIPHPATWLIQGRWDDVKPSPRSSLDQRIADLESEEND